MSKSLELSQTLLVSEQIREAYNILIQNPDGLIKSRLEKKLNTLNKKLQLTLTKEKVSPINLKFRIQQIEKLEDTPSVKIDLLKSIKEDLGAAIVYYTEKETANFSNNMKSIRELRRMQQIVINLSFAFHRTLNKGKDDVGGSFSIINTTGKVTANIPDGVFE
jgi:hypothetical protein